MREGGNSGVGGEWCGKKRTKKKGVENLAERGKR